MKIHEYQAKQLLAEHGLDVPTGRVCSTVEEATAAYSELGSELVVVKAQIHAGGRGKGGGVKLARSAEEVSAAAEAILGMDLITPQTGPEGQRVRTIWVEEGSAIAKEYYVGVAIDRERDMPVMMASSEGGMDIEEVAANSPEKIMKAPFSPATGLGEAEAARLATGIGVPAELVDEAARFLVGLAQLYVDKDCSLAEINPLVHTEDGAVRALDAKINFDSSGLFRHPELMELRDLDEEDPKEIEASRYDLSYISLDGNIACMVNGAGLAMATMDLIKLHGGDPANFLDVGGGATPERVAEAFKLILSNTAVEAILVNIFGGIVRCDLIAEGIIQAVREVNVNVPVVARLEGTNVDKGKALLADSGLAILAADDLTDAAKKVVAAAASK